jgi:hypothetical protein
MDAADDVVDKESDMSSDTENDDDDESSEGGEEDEEESDEEDDYSDDDSFVTSNEDADRDEKEEVTLSYSKVFKGEDEGYEEEDIDDPLSIDEQITQPAAPEVDFSVGGYVATGDM